jgi:hypothetical protein
LHNRLDFKRKIFGIFGDEDVMRIISGILEMLHRKKRQMVGQCQQKERDLFRRTNYTPETLNGE